MGGFDEMVRFMGREANTDFATHMMNIKTPRMLPNGDVVFVDHRHSGCLTEVRSQYDCGACFIFSLVSMLEWTFCMKTGSQIESSDQYLNDCSRPFGLEGCDGGNTDGVIDFLNNIGLELRRDYPYQAREESCPYHDHLHPNVERERERERFSADADRQGLLLQAPDVTCHVDPLAGGCSTGLLSGLNDRRVWRRSAHRGQLPGWVQRPPGIVCGT